MTKQDKLWNIKRGNNPSKRETTARQVSAGTPFCEVWERAEAQGFRMPREVESNWENQDFGEAGLILALFPQEPITGWYAKISIFWKTANGESVLVCVHGL